MGRFSPLLFALLSLLLSLSPSLSQDLLSQDTADQANLLDPGAAPRPSCAPVLSNSTCGAIGDVPVGCRCQFSSQCDDGDGIYRPAAYFTYCAFGGSSWLGALLLFPPLLLYLAVQFSVLGSTAEDYFSPSLEMFSTRLSLPPRFAGVTLLALGNGAPDVSSTISAINASGEGYKLSLGALTGAGMFVTCAVSSIVILISSGVKCRGALVRDVLSLLSSLLLVSFGIGARGVVDRAIVAAFVAFYAAFILVVLAADVYHRQVSTKLSGAPKLSHHLSFSLSISPL